MPGPDKPPPAHRAARGLVEGAPLDALRVWRGVMRTSSAVVSDTQEIVHDLELHHSAPIKIPRLLPAWHFHPGWISCGYPTLPVEVRSAQQSARSGCAPQLRNSSRTPLPSWEPEPDNQILQDS